MERKVTNPSTDDERAKGVLANDAALSQLLSTLRQAIADIVTGRPGDVSQLAQIGISTGATTGSGTVSADAIAGKLTLDASKLSSMLSSRFSDVKALLTNATGSYETEGLSQRLDRILDPQVAAGTGVLPSRISAQDSLIDLLERREADFDVRLAQRERALRAEFTALETVLSQLQSQNAFVTSQLALLSASS